MDIFNFVGKLLDKDQRSPEELQSLQNQFSIDTSDAFLNGFCEALPAEETERVGVLFARLLHVFEYGVLLSGSEGLFRAVAAFDRGNLQTFKQEMPLRLQIPPCHFVEFHAVPFAHRNLFKNITDLIPAWSMEDEMLLSKWTPDLMVFVGTKLARPWLVRHRDRVQKCLYEALSL